LKKFHGFFDLFSTGKEWDRLLSVQKTHFFSDIHIPDLFVFGPAIDVLGKSKLVEKGVLVLQQKSSCFPAVLATENRFVLFCFVLFFFFFFIVWFKRLFRAGIDACAAPGNKTSHLLALLGSEGRVWVSKTKNERKKTSF
jgi:putative methyltransferase